MSDLPIKLVFMNGTPHWRLPEGGFRKANIRDGKIVDPGFRLKGATASH